MGTEVLRPQDCLMRPAPHLIPRRKPNPNLPHQKPFRKPSPSYIRPEAKKRREGSPKPAKNTGGLAGNNQLVMGQVTILKRGESLEVKAKEKEVAEVGGGLGWDPAVFGTDRLGPDPAMIPKQIRLAVGSYGGYDVYAGSAFSLSPSPRALPLPTFPKKEGGSSSAIVDNSATKDLRRLLRLE